MAFRRPFNKWKPPGPHLRPCRPQRFRFRITSIRPLRTRFTGQRFSSTCTQHIRHFVSHSGGERLPRVSVPCFSPRTRSSNLNFKTKAFRSSFTYVYIQHAAIPAQSCTKLHKSCSNIAEILQQYCCKFCMSRIIMSVLVKLKKKYLF